MKLFVIQFVAVCILFISRTHAYHDHGVDELTARGMDLVERLADWEDSFDTRAELDSIKVKPATLNIKPEVLTFKDGKFVRTTPKLLAPKTTPSSSDEVRKLKAELAKAKSELRKWKASAVRRYDRLVIATRIIKRLDAKAAERFTPALLGTPRSRYATRLRSSVSSTSSKEKGKEKDTTVSSARGKEKETKK